MSGISSYAENLALNFAFNKGAATRPVAWGVGLSLGVPTSVSGSEGSWVGYTRQSGSFAAAAAGVITNAVAISFSCSASQTISGFQVWDTVLSSNSGNMLFYGTISGGGLKVTAASFFIFPVGSLTIGLT